MKHVCRVESLAPPTPPPPSTQRIIVQTSFYTDTQCSTLAGGSSFPENPLQTTSDTCTRATVAGQTFYIKAASCGDDASVALFLDSGCQQSLTIDTRKNNACDQNQVPPGALSMKYVCRVEAVTPSTPPPRPVPPTDASSGAGSSATSPGVIAGSVIGALACKRLIYLLRVCFIIHVTPLLRSRRPCDCCCFAAKPVR